VVGGWGAHGWRVVRLFPLSHSSRSKGRRRGEGGRDSLFYHTHLGRGFEDAKGRGEEEEEARRE
jgi:hypothetical protein